MNGTFKLEVVLGSEGMRSLDELASALHRVAERLRDSQGGGLVRSQDGTKVGTFLLEEDEGPGEVA
jgi:hypothetical protein